MSEIELTNRAKNYISLLAKGIDPITGEVVTNNDIINNIKTIRCFNYISSLLENMLATKEVNDTIKSINNNISLNITPQKTPITLTNITKKINDNITSISGKKIDVRKLSNWLINEELLYVHTTRYGNTKKIPTQKGNDLGIMYIYSQSKVGKYKMCLYDINAQKYIYDNLSNILN